MIDLSHKLAASLMEDSTTRDSLTVMSLLPKIKMTN